MTTASPYLFIRPAAMAGRFYPAHPQQLRRDVQAYVSQADHHDPPAPKAIIGPHAGYAFSGAVAGRVYAPLHAAAEHIRRVVLVGPSHRVRFQGIALSSADAFDTPLGQVRLDRPAIDQLAAKHPAARVIDAAHEFEHGLEVHLPFLQEVLGDFQLVPLVVGMAADDEVADVIDALWGGDETLIVISSDLSHFHPYDRAVELDTQTCEAIVGMQRERITPERACGALPIRGLLRAVEPRGLFPKLIEMKNSGDTAGPRDRVVGYGAFTVG